LSAKDYLSMRFDQLQTGYQDYISAMDQTMQQWQTIESVDRAQLEQASANIQSQIDNMTTQMTLEMGGYTNAEEYFAAISEEYMQGPLALDAIETANKEQAQKTGTGILTAGVAAFAIPVVGPIVGGLLCLVGLGFLLFGGGGGSGGTTTTTTVNPGADRH
jgi:hypothetical protein